MTWAWSSSSTMCQSISFFGPSKKPSRETWTKRITFLIASSPAVARVDYLGWPRRRLHSPRAERMKVRPPSPPSAQSVQTKKKPPVDLAISP